MVHKMESTSFHGGCLESVKLQREEKWDIYLSVARSCCRSSEFLYASRPLNHGGTFRPELTMFKACTMRRYFACILTPAGSKHDSNLITDMVPWQKMISGNTCISVTFQMRPVPSKRTWIFRRWNQISCLIFPVAKHLRFMLFKVYTAWSGWQMVQFGPVWFSVLVCFDSSCSVFRWPTMLYKW